MSALGGGCHHPHHSAGMSLLRTPDQLKASSSSAALLLLEPHGCQVSASMSQTSLLAGRFPPRWGDL